MMDMNLKLEPSNNVEIWLVRHGETIFNTKKIVQGWSDSPLTRNGKIMTACLARGLYEYGIRFDAIYSSDLIRCLDTASIMITFMNENLPINSSKNLREIKTGDGEGDNISEHLEKYPYSLNFKKHKGTPNGETWDDVYSRLIPEIYDICNQHSGNGKILVVSHSMAIASILGYLDSCIEEVINIPNSSITKLVCENGKLKLKEHSVVEYIEKGKEFEEEIKEMI